MYAFRTTLINAYKSYQTNAGMFSMCVCVIYFPSIRRDMCICMNFCKSVYYCYLCLLNVGYVFVYLFKLLVRTKLDELFSLANSLLKRRKNHQPNILIMLANYYVLSVVSNLFSSSDNENRNIYNNIFSQTLVVTSFA